MKKKAWLIIIVMIISIAGIMLGRNLQTNSVAERVKVEDTEDSGKKLESGEKKTEVTSSKPAETAANTSGAKNSDNTKDASAEKKNETGSQAAVSKPAKTENKTVPEQKPNFIVTDTITGKMILSKRISFEDETVAKVTTQTLESSKISYRTTGFGSTTYFISIGGLKEREAGDLSGWCYFVNGKKISTGAGSYKVSREDVIEWKYLKDGISN